MMKKFLDRLFKRTTLIIDSFSMVIGIDRKDGVLFIATAFSSRKLSDEYFSISMIDDKDKKFIRTIIFNHNITSVYTHFNLLPNLQEVIFEGDIDQIGSCAFSTNPKLTTVKFNGKCAEIGEAAFYACDALRHINLPDGCKIGKDAFACTPLADILP